MTEAVLQVRDLRVSFPTSGGVVNAVNGVSFDVPRGSTYAIVGESGSGKSVTVSTIMGLTASTAARISGSVKVDGHEIIGADPDMVRSLRGLTMSMVFQDPMSALNPYYTVARQIAEAYQVHHPDASKRERREVALHMLDKVGIPNPSARADRYPHEFSGGMRQRIVIAIALANNPQLLIADEPTTALDVTVQAQILELMQSLQEEFGSAIVLITHDLGIVADVADDVMVMYAGRVVEQARCDHLFETPTHPYTLGLLDSIRSLDDSHRGQLRAIRGAPPSMLDLPSGCAFAPRCDRAKELEGRCDDTPPALEEVGTGSRSACHLPKEARVLLRTSGAAR